MATSDRAGKGGGPVLLQHPDTNVATDVLHAAYVALVAAIAHHEPDALKHVAQILGDEGHVASLPGPGAELARSWLVFTGRGEEAKASATERMFGFAFPATMTFDLVGTGTPKSVARRAMRVLRAMQSEDVPLGAMTGPHPAHPDLLNVTVWAGSFLTGAKDRLVLELAANDAEPEG